MAVLVALLAFGVGLTAVYVTHLWVPQIQDPAVPLMLAVIGGVRLGGWIAHDKRGVNVEHATAWALGFVAAGVVSWSSPWALVLIPVAALYTWSTWGMHKRHYPHHWPRPDPIQRHTDATAEQSWRPLLGNVRPAYRNPDNSNR